MMNAISIAENGGGKMLGLFTSSGMTPEVDRDIASEEPHLAEMTAAALDILEEGKDGFFLMVEGSQIDWANHARDIEYQIGETLAFDDAVEVVLNWVNAHPNRKNNTLVIIVPDHDCGGFAVNGPYGTLSEPGDVVEAGWSFDEVSYPSSAEHTGEDTMIWSMGPGSEYLGAPLDNTDLYWIMVDVLK